MSNFRLDELDFNEAGEWPLIIKLISSFIIFSFICFLSYYYLLTDIQSNIQGEREKEVKQLMELKVKHARAANLDLYKEQLVVMEGMLSVMLRQLPRKSEVPDLLVDISRAGIVSGLEFQLFKPSEENPVDFYAELPIQIRVAGSFHQIGSFIGSMTALSRIVTLHNFSIENEDPERAGEDMIMNITAKTYRYFDKRE